MVDNAEVVKKGLDELRELQFSGDIEFAHGRADEILCEILLAFGCKEVVEAYDEIQKWYA